jgi:DegV family protein with EDD domain
VIVKKVSIVTDSTSCLPGELVEENGICMVPLNIIFEGKSYRDGVDISPNEVYRIMRKRQDLPTTSTPSAGDFLDTFRQLSEETESILCITVTSEQSKIYETALLAKQMAREKLPGTTIEVLDSRAAASAMGLIVLEAARAANSGAGLARTLDVARSMIPRVTYLAMVDTLYYLARTGRIGKAAAWAGSILDIRPIVGHDTSVGVTIPVARPRTRAKAVTLLLELMSERIGESPVHVIVNHADELKDGERLEAEIASRFNCVEIYLAEFAPSMGIHAGPGVLGAAFYTDN